MRRPVSIIVIVLVIVVLSATKALFATKAHGGSRGVEHQIQLGIKMFPTMVGGNLDIKARRNEDGKLLLVILYRGNIRAGEQAADKLRSSVKRIYKYPIRVVVTDDFDFKAFSEEKVAGLFFVEQLSPDQRNAAIRFGINKKAIVFSPFNGDVEKGVMAGMHISTRVQPALNVSTIRKSGIRMNKLFLKVAKTYE